MSVSRVSATSKTQMAIWVAQILLALLFGAAGIAKLIGLAPLVTEFDAIGFGQWFRYLTGVLEIAGAVLLLLGAYAGLGALLVLGICVGAFLAQVFILHGDAIHTIVLAAVAATIVWSQRRQIFAAAGMA